jgi:hypothetical protein
VGYEVLLCARLAGLAQRRPPGLTFVQLPFPAEIREHLLDSCTEDILRLQHLIGGDL